MPYGTEVLNCSKLTSWTALNICSPFSQLYSLKDHEDQYCCPWPSLQQSAILLLYLWMFHTVFNSDIRLLPTPSTANASHLFLQAQAGWSSQRSVCGLGIYKKRRREHLHAVEGDFPGCLHSWTHFLKSRKPLGTTLSNHFSSSAFQTVPFYIDSQLFIA